MTDDPTTKPCQRGHYRAPDGSEQCVQCHGTGRVPLTTGELWDALMMTVGHFVAYADAPGFCTIVLSPSKHDPNIFDEHHDLDDALRAALRAVTG
jgi:hypothetical protein